MTYLYVNFDKVRVGPRECGGGIARIRRGGGRRLGNGGFAVAARAERIPYTYTSTLVR